MNAILVLKGQHEKAKRGFQEIADAEPRERGVLWARLSPELKLHEEMEEEHLYGPVARDAAADARLASWPGQHRHEVKEAEELIEQIGQRSPESREWLSLFQRLKSALEAHIHEEEHDIWPRIEQLWDAKKLERAGKGIEGKALGTRR